MEISPLSLIIPSGTPGTGPNLQAAVNQAKANSAAVWIPADYAGTDTYTNTSSVPIFDMRGAGTISAGAPVTSGLMAEYRILATETPSGLLDYSGNRRNATGTVGTAPTIIANTGGIACTGNGAVILPAALNSALTIQIFMYFDASASANLQDSPVAGNGNGAAGNAIQLLMVRTITPDAWGSDIAGAREFRTFSPGNTFKNSTNSTFAGNGIVTLTLDTTDHIFLAGGQEAQYVVANQTSAGLQTAGAYQLGGAAAGSGNAAQTYLTGNIYYAVFYNRVLTKAEIFSNSAYITNAMAARGIFPSGAPTTDHTNQLIAVGDSTTAGSNASIYWTQNMLNLAGSMNIANVAVSSTSYQTFLTSNPTVFASVYKPGAAENTAVVWMGVNDTGQPASFTTGNARAICKILRDLGFKVLLSTQLSRTAHDTEKNANNAVYRQSFLYQYADGLVDQGADPNLGADGASANTTFFSDGLHPSIFSVINLQNYYFQRAINRLWGAKDFSSATVYAAAATAAVATTAGSQVGNTVTITFGATPANCQIGNIITMAGITPAGYNGSFYIRTRSATQITYYNSVTGLGAITVQGTGVSPQQQDADQYQVLNFGAGNYTLQTCLGYTGQNIYISNINAVASTLVPFASETITGAGAAPTTLAANTTAILQSQLVSAAAGGCNWVRLQ